jgi:hypothetical protein
MVFRAGVSESKIMPPIGVSMAGYAARKDKEITIGKIATVYAKIELGHAKKAALLPKKEIDAELQAIALDNTLLIGLPGEFFAQIGLNIKTPIQSHLCNRIRKR